jgi:hypothetical protein
MQEYVSNDLSIVKDRLVSNYKIMPQNLLCNFVQAAAQYRNMHVKFQYFYMYRYL